MVTSPAFAFCLTCLFLGRTAQASKVTQPTAVYQENGFLSAAVGEDLTLQCFYDTDAAKYFWYKQTPGEKPRLISVFYKFDKNFTFRDEFKDNPRFTLETEVGKNHLKITDIQPTDTATYYCASGYSFMIKFMKGTVVDVKDSDFNIRALVHQSTSGGSETLNCTVHTGTCGDGEHSVYWLKDSGEPHPGLIYTQGSRNDQCVRNNNTETHTCVYNLPMKSMDVSHAGTYYCAVASCGRILFGNESKLDFEDEMDPIVLAYFLSGALSFTIILIVLLTMLAHMISQRNNCQCTASFTTAEGYQDADDVHYAAIRVNTSRRQRTPDNTETECVYSRVRQ